LGEVLRSSGEPATPRHRPLSFYYAAAQPPVPGISHCFRPWRWQKDSLRLPSRYIDHGTICHPERSEGPMHSCSQRHAGCASHRIQPRRWCDSAWWFGSLFLAGAAL